MAASMIWLWSSLLLAIPASGEECQRNFEIKNGDNTESLFDNCTTIVGDIDLGERFRGPVTMGNVANVTGTLSLRAPGSDDTFSVSSVQRLEAPALEYLGGLVIANTAMGDVDLPKLKNITGEMSISPSDGSAPKMHFPALEGAGAIDIRQDSQGEGTPPIDVNLLSLKSAESIRLSGYLSSINMPELTVVGISNGDTTHSDSSGLDIQLAERGRELDIIFPQLEVVEGYLRVSGKMGAISLNGLRRTSANITIEALDPVSIKFLLLEAGTIALNGYIKSVIFSQIRRFYSVSVDSKLDFDCDEFTDQLKLTYDAGHISCAPQSKRLSSKTKIALGVIIPIAFVVVASVITLILRRRRRLKDKVAMAAQSEPPPPYNLEMSPMPPARSGPAPPPYSAS